MGSCSSKKEIRCQSMPSLTPIIPPEEKYTLKQNFRGKNIQTNFAKTTFSENGSDINLIKQNSYRTIESPKILTNTIKLGLFKFYSFSDKIDDKKIDPIQDRQIRTIQHNVSGVYKRIQAIAKNGIQTTQFISKIQKNPLDCEYITSINEIYQDFGYFYLLQDYCSGGSIGKNSGILKDTQVIHLLIQMISAIEYLHSKKMFHGNLTKHSFHFLNESNSLFCKLVDISQIYEKQKSSVYCNQQMEILQDIQQLGQIAYFLLEGCKPFTIQQKKEKKIQMIGGVEKIIEYEKEILYFGKSTNQALTKVIKKMLNVKEKKKITLTDAKRILEEQQNKKIPIEILQKPLLNLSKCKKRTYFQSVILSYMLNKFSAEEEIILSEIFKFIDKDYDGFINQQDLLDIYKLLINYDNLHIHIDELFTKLDINANGTIELQEFQAAACDIDILLTKQNIDTTFKLLQNQNQWISASSVKRFMSFDEELFKKDIYEQVGFYHFEYSDFIYYMNQIFE